MPDTISRTLTDSDDLIDYELTDGMTALEAVGMLTMTINTVLDRGITDSFDSEDNNED